MRDVTGTTSHADVLRTLRALESELRAAGVRHIALFGSMARGEDSAGSDVDLALDFAPESLANGFEFITQIQRLKRRLTAALRRDVDIVVLPARRPELRDAISREAIPAF
jgi:predicted nucleotidyltransferase